ncbi:MAG: PEP-CTERM sorting domain-containing protein [Pirellulales bacterium]
MLRTQALLAVVLCAVLAGTSHAGPITLSQAQLLVLAETFEDPVNSVTGAIFDTWADGAGVQFEVSLKDSNGPPLVAEIGVGASAASLNLTDLSAYDGLSMVFTNVNNSSWSVASYLKTAGNNYYQTPLTNLSIGDTAVVNLDFAGVANLNQVAEVGFVIAGDMTGLPPNPSISDVTHIRVEPTQGAQMIPIPEPSSFVLAALALVGLAGLAVRRRAA